MELVFEEQSIDYLRRIFSGSAAQELTQELIVPDSYRTADALSLPARARSCAARSAGTGARW